MLETYLLSPLAQTPIMLPRLLCENANDIDICFPDVSSTLLRCRNSPIDHKSLGRYYNRNMLQIDRIECVVVNHYFVVGSSPRRRYPDTYLIDVEPSLDHELYTIGKYHATDSTESVNPRHLPLLGHVLLTEYDLVRLVPAVLD